MARKISTREAINEAISQSMRADEQVFIMGEDIGGGAGHKDDTYIDTLGGGFGVTKGLQSEFGRKRVIDMPISETGFLGMSLGAAFAGMRPIVEIMYVDFIGVCFDQLLNQISKFHYIYGGKKSAPIVIRTPVGAGLQAGAEHSQTLYPLFASLPGIKVVTPSSAYDAKGLLMQAIKDNDPVVFLEHKKIYLDECEVPEEPYYIEFGKADIKKEGSDVTIIGIQKMVVNALEAAKILEKEGISVEVVDLRTISPLDVDTMVSSALKTGRVIVAEESYPRCGLAADFSAILYDNVYGKLKKPIMRVMPPHAPIPYPSHLEEEWVPSVERLVNSVKELMK